MMGLSVVVALILAVAIAHAAPQEPQSIQLSFTIRSFLPITCGTNADIYKYWRGPPFIISRAPGCPLADERRAGTVIPHPDFQIGYESWANESGPTRSYYWAPGGGTPGFLNPLQSNPRQLIRGSLVDVPLDRTLTPLVEPYLEIDDNTGLGKPVYCKQAHCGIPYHVADPTWPHVNPEWTEFPDIKSLASEETFRVWYRDDSRYNRRVGITMDLTRVAQKYVYDSNKFHPLDRFVKEEPDAIFPLTENQEAKQGGGRKYFFTSECHTFFEYRPGQVFSFQGDDDFMAFINNRLVVDLSGMHEPYESSIDLSAIASTLNLVPGMAYPLDIFHAERRMINSNFKMTTNLISGCNVLNSGAEYALTQQTTTHTALKMFNSELRNDGSIDLTPLQFGFSSYAFLKTPQNIAQGFSVVFTYSVNRLNGRTRLPEGFAFVIHRDPFGLRDINGGSGGHLGARNFRNSIVIAFDFCADRNYAKPISQRCAVREVRLHTNYGDAARANIADQSTRRLQAGINFRMREFVEGKAYQVRIVYYGKDPNWLEVYVDNSLLMNLRGFDAVRDLGGQEAYLGLTSATGSLIEHTGGVLIRDWSIQTVPVVPANTQFHMKSLWGYELPADGRNSYSITIGPRDGCDDPVSYGGMTKWVSGWMERIGHTDRRRRRLTTNTSLEILPDEQDDNDDDDVPFEPMFVPVDIVDHLNGTYDIQFRSSESGEYKLVAVFGECAANITNILMNSNASSLNTNETLVAALTGSCWWMSPSSSLLVVPVPAAPVLREPDPPKYPWHIVAGVGGGLGATTLICCVLVFVLLGARRRWRKEKKFVTTGQLAILERDVEYGGNPLGLQIMKVANKVERTNHDILKLRALVVTDRTPEIEAITKQNMELQEEIRIRKRRLQQDDQSNDRGQLDLTTPIVPPRRRVEPPKERMEENVDVKGQEAVFVHTKHSDASFRVCFSQRDVALIEGFIDDYPDSIIGGDLFGMFDARGDCQILHATGPGVGAKFGRTAFTQDEYFTERALDYLASHTPSVRRIGKWLSFHKMAESVQAHIEQAWSESKSMDKFVFLAVHTKQIGYGPTSQKQVIISPILFESGSTVHKFGQLCVLDDARDWHASIRHSRLERMRRESNKIDVLPRPKRNQSATMSTLSPLRTRRREGEGETTSLVISMHETY